MEPRDKNYLSLQFWIRVYRKNATEFQGFFEDIMQKAHIDFRKVRPYGKKGDAGNDGYIPDKGIYFQVYAPSDPKEKEAKAAQKLKADFEKLKAHWNKITTIRHFYFVFNDKGGGSTIDIENALAELRVNNQNINFDLFTPKDLEKEFSKLKPDDLLALEFDVDATKAIRIAAEYLQKIEIELDRECINFAQRLLSDSKDVIFKLKDEGLALEYDLLDCRCLGKQEKVDEAIEKYKDVSTRAPKDPRPFLYLAEFYLLRKKYKKNKELLVKAASIDKNYWLLKLEELIRNIHLEENIDTSNLDESLFPDDNRIKAIFYRIYAQILEANNEKTRADSFIENAIYFNPNDLSNYITKLAIIETRMYSKPDNPNILNETNIFLEQIENVEMEFYKFGDIRPEVNPIV